MPQSISLWGATYSDVPGVELPKSTSGTALFTDVTPTTATDSDVASGKIYFKADGTQSTGTASGGGTPAISVVDTTDSHGGTVRTITALDISDTTAIASDVASGKYFYTANGTKTQGTASGGGGATQHTIHLEFTDSTDTDIEVDYDDSLIATMITSYDPVTYGQKTVDSAALDGVIWYQRPTETWETIFDDDTQLSPDSDNDYPYCWITSLSSYQITQGSEWRVTYQNVQYRLTAVYDAVGFQGNYGIGNPKWAKGTDNGSDAPFCLGNPGWGAWTGSFDLPNTAQVVHIKVERRTA